MAVGVADTDASTESGTGSGSGLAIDNDPGENEQYQEPTEHAQHHHEDFEGPEQSHQRMQYSQR